MKWRGETDTKNAAQRVNGDVGQMVVVIEGAWDEAGRLRVGVWYGEHKVPGAEDGPGGGEEVRRDPVRDHGDLGAHESR